VTPCCANTFTMRRRPNTRRSLSWDSFSSTGCVPASPSPSSPTRSPTRAQPPAGHSGTPEHERSTDTHRWGAAFRTRQDFSLLITSAFSLTRKRHRCIASFGRAEPLPILHGYGKWGSAIRNTGTPRSKLARVGSAQASKICSPSSFPYQLRHPHAPFISASAHSP
jgi:hypothetical protein